MKALEAIFSSQWVPLGLFLLGVIALVVIHYDLPGQIFDRQLRISVIRYTYDDTTGDLVTDVEFVNNGEVRRTVANVMFTYHPDDSDTNGRRERQIITPVNAVFGVDNPLYIEPKVPVVVTYRKHLQDPSLLHKAGMIFGLKIDTITVADGSLNFTNIDIMEVRAWPQNQFPPEPVTSRISRLSLDKPFHYY